MLEDRGQKHSTDRTATTHSSRTAFTSLANDAKGRAVMEEASPTRVFGHHSHPSQGLRVLVAEPDHHQNRAWPARKCPSYVSHSHRNATAAGHNTYSTLPSRRRACF